MSILGNRVLRTEDDRFLRGQGRYVENLFPEGTATVTFVRSLLAHAKIDGIDTSAAEDIPGVKVFLADALIIPSGILTAAYLGRRLGPEGYGIFTVAAALVAWVEWSLTGLFARASIKVVADARDWPDATVVNADPIDVVARLKEESDVPLRSHGSLILNRALMAAGLVDRV